MNLYVHVPFCRKKCAYCAFYSEEAPSGGQIDAYLRKLEQDLRTLPEGCRVTTLYFGGGTPTLLSAAQLKRLYGLFRRFSFAPDAEITSECNPGTLTPEKAAVMGSFINRVSMGVQSFSPETLHRIGRAFPEESDPAGTFRLLRENGITNLGLDLIYATPGQTMADLEADLERALELAPKHVSAYSLILEEKTLLASRIREADLPDDALSAGMWKRIGERLASAGLPRYEVSNYASKAFHCRHNDNVWHGEAYAAFGPAACSFDGVVRKTQVASLEKWLNGAPPEVDELAREKRLREIFIMGMRTVAGWTTEAYDWTFLRPELEKLERQGYLVCGEQFIRPTEKGLLFWNDLAEELI